MVDFAKIMADKRAAQAEEATNKPVEKRKLTELERVNHMIEKHLGQVTERESEFLYSVRVYLMRTRADGTSWNNFLSRPQLQWLQDLEDQYCGSICHALNSAGIAHD